MIKDLNDIKLASDICESRYIGISYSFCKIIQLIVLFYMNVSSFDIGV